MEDCFTLFLAGNLDLASPQSMPNQTRVGRPAKFQTPRRAVTITLPESTLQLLQSLDEDRSIAIVRAVDIVQSQRSDRLPIEIVPVGQHNGLIITVFGSAYFRIPFVKLVEVEPGRNLIALDPGHSIADLEIAITDLVNEGEELTEQDRSLMETLLAMLRKLRKSDKVRKAEILLVNLGSTPPEQALRSNTENSLTC